MLDAVRRRRSIRHYQDRPIEPELVEHLKESMLRSPSSRNLRPWRFVFVSDREKLEALSHAKPSWATPIAESQLAVVLCGDAGVSDCWIEDCSIAATVLQLTATDLGLGSCWIQIRDRRHEDGRPSEDYVREVLGLSPSLRVLCAVSIGYPAEEKEPRAAEELDWEKVSEP